MKQYNFLKLLTLFCCLFFETNSLLAQPLSVQVLSAKGEVISLPGAVVWAEPYEPTTPATQVNQQQASTSPSEMAQQNRQFSPFILAVQKNVPVSFPNKDQTAHHVYSFSKTKSFELPLYRGSTGQPISFPNAGLVPLGCNIHDWMIGFILVVDTPYFRQFNSETMKFPPLQDGRYKFNLYHPSLDGREFLAQDIQIVNDAEKPQSTIRFQLRYPIQKVTQPKAPSVSFDEEDDY